MTTELLNALKMVADEKSMDLKDLIATIESAVTRAAMKRLNRENLEVRFDQEKGEFDLFEQIEVVESVENSTSQISLEEALKLDESHEVGSFILEPVKMEGLGRIAAQSVRQMIHKKGKEAEHHRILEEYRKRIGEVVTGTMEGRSEAGILFNLGDVGAVLPKEEQVVNDKFNRGQHVKLAIADVCDRWSDPVVVSRVSPALLSSLLELETPEIGEGLVEMVNVVRDNAGRSKVAVKSKKRDIDPVGACVGVRGSRIQPIVRELNGEKIDIIAWSDDPKQLIASALAPAKNVEVILDEKSKNADVIVPDDQLSPAIGKRGVNVKLAVKLTGWELDVMNSKEYEEKKIRVAKFKGHKQWDTPNEG